MFLRISFIIALAFCTNLSNAQEEALLSWEQLSAQFECPAWYSEAKFGIWTHWGAQTQPAEGSGWYARHMYMNDFSQARDKWGKGTYEFHLKTYGHPSEKGFKDVIHEWKAENLDTDALLVYFKSLGAKYFVALSSHHDHFDNFDSTHHPWNSVNVGPKRDIIGEFSASAKKHGMPFGISSHDDRFETWWLPAFGADAAGPKKGIPYDGRLTLEDGKGKWWEGLDPADLYGLPPEKRTPETAKALRENWLLRHTELAEKYDLDMLWFDGHGFPYKDYGKEVCRRFYNQSLRKHGKINAVVVGKVANQPATITDIENGVADKILPRPWQSITTMGPWFHKGKKPYNHNARTVIEMLSDVISKNGNLLLNVDLLPDGTIPPKTKLILDDIGQWVNLNAEAIYATNPWKIHGDNLGSTARRVDYDNLEELDIVAAKKHKKSGHFNQRTVKSPPYSFEEVRFTTKDSRLFVFVLNPSAGVVELPAMGLDSPHKPGTIKSIRIIGGTQEIKFKQNAGALELTVPEERPTKYTAVFEIVGAL